MTDETTTQPQEQNLTDSPHYLAQALMANGIKNMYGVVGIPVTDFARIAQGMGMRFIGMRHEEDVVNAIRLGAVNYLKKPFRPQELMKRVSQEFAKQ